ncbi:hypothetical protein A1D22_05090 [Pasteurellaceae bacterium LFhippo2]|nr:hypothetical protein [Pasteurellaceae bacterium LFhippo2]
MRDSYHFIWNKALKSWQLISLINQKSHLHNTPSKNLLFSALASLSFILPIQATELDDKIQEHIQAIKAKEQATVYDREIDSTRAVHVGNDEKVSATFNQDINGRGSYVVFSNVNPSAVKVTNNAVLSSAAEVIASRHNNFSDMMYIINNGSLVGLATGGSADTLSLVAPTVYVHNTENGLMTAKALPLLLASSSSFALENEGDIISDSSTAISNWGLRDRGISTLVNSGTISSGESHAISISRKDIYFKNSGEITGYYRAVDLTGSYHDDGVVLGENSGTITNTNPRGHGLEISVAHSKFDNKNKISGVNIYANKNAQFSNSGDIDKLMNITSANVSLTNSGKITSDVNIGLSRGGISDITNNGTINGNLNIKYGFTSTEVNDPKLTVHLEDGAITDSVNLLNDLRNSTNHTTNVFINGNTNIGGTVEGAGDKDTLTLLGTGTISDAHKYNNIEHLVVDGDWALSASDITFKESTTVNNKLTLNSDGSLISNAITNNPSSIINVDSGFRLQGNLKNSGTIDFTNKHDTYKTLEVMGDYAGTDGRLKMGVSITGLVADVLKVTGKIVGQTLIDLYSPDSTLASKMEEGKKILLVDNNTEQPDSLGTFSLTQSTYGDYTYQLEKLANGWYLSQLPPPPPPVEPEEPVQPDPVPPKPPVPPVEPEPVPPKPPVEPTPTPPIPPAPPVEPEKPVQPEVPVQPETPVEPEKPVQPETPVEPEKPTPPKPVEIKAEVGVLANSIAVARDIFTMTFNERSGAKRTADNKNVWGRIYHKQLRNRIEGNDVYFAHKGHSTSAQLGVDLAKIQNEDSQFTFGVFGSLGKHKNRGMQAGRTTPIFAELSAYNVGLYATYEKPNWYTDSWVAYTRVGSEVNAPNVRHTYHLNGVQASMEAGYNFVAIKESNKQLSIQPQVQLVYSHFKQPNLVDFKLLGTENLTTRVGTRFQLELPSISPYVSLNYWHNSHRVGVKSQQGTFMLEGNRDMGEAKIGFDSWKLTPKLNVWADVGFRFGGDHYREQTYHASIRYAF